MKSLERRKRDVLLVLNTLTIVFLERYCFSD